MTLKRLKLPSASRVSRTIFGDAEVITEFAFAKLIGDLNIEIKGTRLSNFICPVYQ